MWWVVAEADAQSGVLGAGTYTTSGTGGHRFTVFPEIDTVLVFRTDTDGRRAPPVASSECDRFLAKLMSARLKGRQGPGVGGLAICPTGPPWRSSWAGYR
jgi:hypothetical protein